MRFFVNRLAKKLRDMLLARSGPGRGVSRRLMFPLSLLSAAVVSITAVVWYVQYQKNADQQSVAELGLMMRDFQSLISQQAKGLSIALVPITQNDGLKQALKAKDKATLLKQWAPVYERMRKEGVSHFYILDANRVCLLRVHKPSRGGDVIDRFTARQAEVLGRRSWGIELGAMGLFTLRVVEPVYDEGRLIGYVELGKEVEDAMDELLFHFGHGMLLMIDKHQIGRSSWEEGMAMMGRHDVWETNRDFVISYATSEELISPFGPVGVRSHAHVARGETMRVGDRRYEVSYLPVHDAAGKEVAHMQVIRDTTAAHRSFLEAIALMGVIGIAFLGIVLWIIRSLLAQADDCVHAGKEENDPIDPAGTVIATRKE